MRTFLKKNIVTLFTCAVLVSLTGITCTKKNNPASSGDDDTPQIPTLTIITPADDSLFDEETDSVSLTAFIKNSDYIDSVEVNGKKVSLLSIGDDTLTVRMALENDSSDYVITVYYQKTKSMEETITVFRDGPDISVAGMAKISGVLLQESTGSAAKRLAKAMTAMNAQGTEASIESVIPVSGADIMIYDAEALSTTSDTVVTTGENGEWAVEIEPGNYFVFAVYFDRENLEIVTTALPDIKAEKDRETKTDSAIAISDDVKPMLLTFLDAAEANDENMFIGSEVPEGLPVVMSFSEPMTRASAGDATSGIVLGPVDPEDTELELLDTIKVKKLWGPNGKELRLVPESKLTVGKTYKVVIPAAVKDLALNKLDDGYVGIFDVVEADDLPPFALRSTAPADGDTIPPGFPVECIFTRPVDVLSLNKHFTISSDKDETVEGFFEVKGNVARFMNKKPLMPDAGYELGIDEDALDLLGEKLGKPVSLSFHTAPRDSFEQKDGAEGMVASAVKMFMGAYIAGDIETFSQSFHPSFELIESSEEGENRLQLSTFLDQMRSEINERNRLAKYGIVAPVFHYPKLDGERIIAWKLIKDDVSLYFEDMGPDGGVGRVPRILTMDNEDVAGTVVYVDRGFIYNDDTLYFAPQMDKAFIDEDAREGDPAIFGKLLKNTTNVETQDIMLELRSDFIIRNLTMKGDDTAQVMIEVVEEERYMDGKRPFPIVDPQNPPPDIEKHVMALQTKIVFTSGKWMVLQIAAKELYKGDIEEFDQKNIAADDFKIQNFEQTRPIEFLSPKHKAVSVGTPVEFEWGVANKDGIGGYLIAIANELSGGNEGLLVFTTKTTLTISENGAVDDDATILSVDPASLMAPIPMFSARLSSFSVDDEDVYVWKVMGIKSSTASAISAGEPVHIIADSDFGSHHGIGIFTLLDEMPDIAMNLSQFDPAANMGDDRFADRDGDGYPDWIERAYATSPEDPGNHPNFTLDTDQDGFADFMEIFAGSDPEDKESKPEDSEPKDNIPDVLQTRPEWRPELNIDDDGDGYPTEVEMIFGTDPWDPQSKPSKSIKAAVPVNTYYGGIRIGDQEWKRINFSLVSDTSGNFAVIETTELQGIARGGVDLTAKLFWNNGEWVFFLGVVDGPNTGRFIKVRFRNDGMYLRGPVDLADMVNGGGPYIGEFVASVEEIQDFENIGGPVNPSMNPDDPNAPLNLGPPPMEMFDRPADEREDMTLVLAFPENAPPEVTAIIPDATIEFENPFWAPGQFPALGCDVPNTSAMYHLEGNLHRIGDPASDDDSLVMVGVLEFDTEDPNGGIFRERFDYIVFLKNPDDVRRPAGTWNGWLIKPQMMVNQGPNPYIGPQDSVEAALSITGNKGFVMETGEIVTIETTAQDMNVWKATAGEDSYFIMEVMGDFLSVMFEEVDGALYIVLSSGGGGMGGPGGPGMPYSGDRAAIVAALDASNNEVSVAAPNPFMITVDPSTLQQITTPEGMVQWEVADAAMPDHRVIFLAVEENSGQLRMDNNRPMVFEMMNGPGPVPFEGDSMTIVTALENSNNEVQSDNPDASVLTVDPGSLHRMPAPDDSDRFGWAVAVANNETDVFVFLADPADPMKLILKNNRPAVFKP
jgi:hypothetical protein